MTSRHARRADAEGVYVASNNGRVTALDPSTFATTWSKLSTGAEPRGTVNEISSDDRYVYVAVGNGTLAVRRKTDGALVWYIDLDDLPGGFEQSLRAPGLDGEIIYWGGINANSYAFRRR